MGSITQSPDRIAQVLSGSAVQHGAGDSAVQPADSNPNFVVEQAATGVSAAEFVYESRRQFPSVSEGVASAGAPPQLAVDRMDEFVPFPGRERPQSGVVGFEGETSGGADGDAGGGSNGYGGGPSAHAAGSPMDHQSVEYQATNASALHSPAMHPPNGHTSGKRKSCSEGAEFLEPKRPEGGLNRVPSDLAMVIGLSDGEGGEGGAGGGERLPDACDSTVAGAAPLASAAAAAADGAETEPGSGVALDAARPTDADIIAWENQIREEEVRNIPLIGEVEPLAALAAEYAAGSDVFLAKIAALRQGYASIRRTRGDGNCFFRSFLFAYLEGLVAAGDVAERDRAVLRLTAIKQRLLEAGYDELVLESPLELLLGMLRSVCSPSDPLTLEALEGNLRAEDLSNYIVFLLRMATSAEVKRRADFFAPFVLGLADMDVDTFCRACIDPMGEESDHVHLVALTDVLQVPIRVVYLDRSQAPAGGTALSDGAANGATVGAAGDSTGGGTALSSASIKADVHDFLPDQYAGSPEPRVHLLYRPGHYDVLYPRS